MRAISVRSTDCRNTIDGRFNCESSQNSIFLGILDGEDLVWTNAGSTVPTAGVSIAHNGEECPRLDRGEPTLPVRSKYTCIDVAKHIGRAVPPDKAEGRIEFEVIEENLHRLPKHTCFIDKEYRSGSSDQTRWVVIWNEGDELKRWDEQSTSSSGDDESSADGVIDMHKIRVDGEYDPEKKRYATLCLKPFVNYRDTAPPSPPAAGEGASYTLLTRNQECETIQDPCDCCTSKQQATEDGPIEDCVVAPRGTTFTDLTKGALYHTLEGMCTTLRELNETGVDANENIGSCSSIRPFCYPSPTSVVFSPLGGTRYETLCSATLYLDVYRRFQGIVVGTSAGSSNAMLYISRSDVVRRTLSGDPMEHSVAVSTSRLKGESELICFANSNARVTLRIKPAPQHQGARLTTAPVPTTSQNRCHLIKLDPQWPSFVQDYSQQTTGAAEADSWEEVLQELGTQQNYDCSFEELSSTDDNPPKMFDYNTMPMWPYPRALPIVGTGSKQGEILKTRTWSECLELCKNTPGCVYVFRPGACKSITGDAVPQMVHTTWTDPNSAQNYGRQCFMYNTYNARVASDESKDCNLTNWDAADCETKVKASEHWRSKDWCHGSTFRNAINSDTTINITLGSHDEGDGYKHAVSSCANSKFKYSSYTFGHPDETTTGISIL